MKHHGAGGHGARREEHMHLNRILLEGAFARVARALTRQHGMSVRFRGAQAYVTDDHATMNLPALDALDGARLNERQTVELHDLVGAEEGFVDHECGHVRYTERGLMEHYPWKRKADRTMCNVLEDYRIEYLMGEAFPGCKENIAFLNGWARRKNVSKLEEQAADGKNGFGRLCLAILDRLTFGEQWGAIEARNPDLATALAIVAPMVDEFAARVRGGTIDSRETAAAAVRIMDAIAPLDPLPEDPSGRAAAEAEDGSPGVVGAPVVATGEPGVDQKADEKMGSLRRGIHAGDWEVPDNGAVLARELTGMIRPDDAPKAEPTIYVPFSTEFDVEKYYGQAERAWHRDAYHAYRAIVVGMISPIAAVLEGVLLSEAEDRWVGEQEYGPRFDRRMLARLAAGADVFDRARMQRVPGDRVGAAVSLLIDRSGSMGAAEKIVDAAGCTTYSKAYTARLGALAFHEALLATGVPHEVVSFSTGSSMGLKRAAAAAAARGEDLRIFARGVNGTNLLHDVFKSFDDDDAFPIVEVAGRGANCDGESLLWAARRLARREEPRKILIVFSDGQPSGVDTGYYKLECDYLADTVRRLIVAGIEVYAIGIEYEGVREYYPRHVVVEKLADLPRVTVLVLQRMLIDHRRDGRYVRI